MKKKIALMAFSLALLSALAIFNLFPAETKSVLASVENYTSSLYSATFESDSTNAEALVTEITGNEIKPYDPNIQTAADLSTNFEPMEGTGHLIDESEATTESEVVPELENTGEEYTFSSSFYPYYEMLTDNGKNVYNQVYANSLSVTQTAFPLVSAISKSELENVMSAVYNDHPEIFWMDTNYSYSYTANGKIISLQLDFNTTIENLDSNKALFESAATQIIEAASAYTTVVDQEKYVHNYLMDNVTYDESASIHQSAFSALVLGNSVCAGYSRAFQYIMMELGVPCYYCTGTANNGNHAWNIILINDSYYNVDTSWNDSVGTANNTYAYVYFNTTDDVLVETHSRTGLSVYLPACNGTDKTYAQIYGENEAVITQDSLLSSYSELGYTESDIISNIEDYYDKCEQLLTTAGIGTHSFSLLLANQDLYESICLAGENQEHTTGYLQAVVDTLQLTDCTASLELAGEELADGYVLLTQKIILTGNYPTN